MPLINDPNPNSYKLLVHKPGWHDGTGSIGYEFLTEVPGYYPEDTNGATYVPDLPRQDPPQDVTLTAQQKVAAEAAIQLFNEIANLGLVEILAAGGSPHGSPVAGDGHLVDGLGGNSGYGDRKTIGFNNPSSSFVTDVFEEGLDFFGIPTGIPALLTMTSTGAVVFNVDTNVKPLYVIDGAVGDEAALLPDDLLQLIAPFWSEMDLTEGGGDRFFVDIDPVADVVTLTWLDVTYLDAFAIHNAQGLETPTNSFQLQLYDRGGGDFDIVYRFESIEWDTALRRQPDNSIVASALSARAGFSTSDGNNFFEIEGSGVVGGLLDLDTRPGNTGVPGLWVFEVRNGQITLGSFDFTDDGPDDGTLAGFVVDYPHGDFPTNLDPLVVRNPSFRGDVWFNEIVVPPDNDYPIGLDMTNPRAGDAAWWTIMHELGHAVGLHHPDELADLGPWRGVTYDPNVQTQQFSMMSGLIHPGTAGGDPVYPMTPMVYDIQALQELYGPNMSTRTGDDTYFGPGPSAQYQLADSPTVILSVWDAGGNDTFSAANQTDAVVFDLRAGHYSTIGAIVYGIGIAFGVTIENAIGGSSNDAIYGNEVANLLSGGPSNDWLRGFQQDDRLYGDAGPDELWGEDGDDRLRGGEGDDTLLGHAGIDRLQGDEDPAVAGSSGNDTAYGGTNADELAGSGGDDVLHGDEDSDRVAGGTGRDRLYGGDDADQVEGNAGDDTIYGGDGTDLVMADRRADEAGVAQDRLYGGDGADLVLGSAGNDSLAGDDGSDWIDAALGDDVASGGEGTDFVLGGAGDDVLFGGDGSADALIGGAGDDGIYGGDDLGSGETEGDDWIQGDGEPGAAGDDRLFGGFGDDVIDGAGGDDLVYGGPDNDFVDAGSGDDTVIGEPGDDLLDLGSGRDYAFGGLGNDWLDGGEGNDTLFGDFGQDTIFGGDGNDTIYGSAGEGDWLFGGAGADIFVIEVDAGQDTIGDWEDGIDRIDASAVGSGAMTVTDHGPADTSRTVSVQFGANSPIIVVDLAPGQLFDQSDLM